VTTDLQVWAIAGISVLVLTLMVGMPPALTAQRLKIVDALAGRGNDSPLERLLRRGLEAIARHRDDDGEARTP
jgi:putative ABC transport system permease protein